MTQQLGSSLRIQESEDQFSSEFLLPSDSVSIHLSTKVHSVKPKRKRGRPRKMLPLNALTKEFSSSKMPTTPHVDRSRKKNLAKKDFLRGDSSRFDDDLPFPDEELTTLDEFEKMRRTAKSKSDKLENCRRLDKTASTPVPLSNQKKRRQIDPSTCERDYSQEEIEFMNALSEYKRSSGRLFPTCSEILEVLKNLGYEKQLQEI